MTGEDANEYLIVVDHGTCRDCRRPISLVEGVGWLHRESPEDAQEEFACGGADPSEIRCPQCGGLVPGLPIAGGTHIFKHSVGSGVETRVCRGSGALMPGRSPA